MQYENRVVCFIDILGFKEIIKETENSSKKLENTINAIKILLEYKDYRDETTKFTQESKQITQFSDCIVISYLVEEKSQLFFTILEIQHMLIHLIQYGFLARGGISFGKLIHTNKILMGPALIEAYELETKKAIYPRVILPSELITLSAHFRQDIHTPKEEEEYIKQCLQKDDDEWYYIDFINISGELNTESDYPEYLVMIQNIIKNGLKIKKDKIIEKYKWLSDKYNVIAKKIIFNRDNIEDIPLKELYKEIEYINT